MTPEPPYSHGSIGKTGILLVNLGTPDAPTAQAVRTYLKEFLSDPRVVEIPRALWWLILHGFILNTRPKKSAEKYAQIWTPDGSPLQVHTEYQAKLLLGFLGERIKPAPVVEYAMRYGNPAIAEVLGRMKQQGCERILAFRGDALEKRHDHANPALRVENYHCFQDVFHLAAEFQRVNKPLHMKLDRQ